MKYEFETMIERFADKNPQLDRPIEEALFDELSAELKHIKSKYNDWKDYAPIEEPNTVLDLYSIAEGYRLYHDLDLRFLYQQTK